MILSIDKDNSNRLFYRPSIKREEPFVSPADNITYSSIPEPPDSNSSASDTADEILYIYDNLNFIIDDYAKLLDVLIKRADMRGLELFLYDLLRSDKDLSSAIYSIFGEQKSSLKFGDYLDLLIYEKELVTASTIAEINQVSSGDSSIKYNIGKIKGLFITYIYEKGAEDLLMSNLIVNRISEINSVKSALAEVDKTADGGKLTNKIYDKDKKNKLDKWIQDCVPCQNRSFGIYEDFKKMQPFKAFIDMTWKRLLGELRYLANLRLSISGVYFSQDICRLIDQLTPSKWRCVPDIQAILNLLQMSSFRLKKLIRTEFSNINISVDSIPISIATGAVADSLVAMLSKIVNNVFSAIDCYLTSIELQTAKLDDSVREFYVGLKQNYDDTYSWLMGLIGELNKIIRQDITFGDSITKLYSEIDKIAGWISLTQEILSTYNNYKGIIDPNEWKRIGKSICATAYGNTHPWLEAIIDITIDNDDTDDRTPIGNPPTNTDPKPKPKPKPISKPVIIKDNTLPSDFFSNDPLNILKDPKFKQYYSNIDFDDTLENGDDILRIDDSIINRYTSISEAIEPYAIELDFLPVKFFTFDNCISAEGLSDYTEEQINEWINKVK